MKYVILIISLFAGQLMAQTTQPTTPKPAVEESNKAATGPKKLYIPKKKEAKKPVTERMPEKAYVPEKVEPETMVSEAELMEKYGIADSEKNDMGGLTPGQVAPDFSGVDQHGNKLELKELIKKGKVVVIFYRGYWCGICNKHLAELEAKLSSITDNGATVIAVTTESNEFANKTIEKNNLTFSVISDTDNKIARDYKVLYEATLGYQKRVASYTKSTLQKFNDSKDAYLPIPATYIIDQNGNVSYMHYSMDYSNRASIEEIAKYSK